MEHDPVRAPCWNEQVAALFADPYWIAPPERQSTAQTWAGCMSGYGVQLGDYLSVKQWSVVIYQYLHSREMPLTSDPSQFWPDEALETLRLWVNQGWRETPTDPFAPQERIPVPRPVPVALRIRRDLRSLTQAELDVYRMRVDDAFHMADASPDAPGQVFFSIHGDWCLHYQEAFLLWHRAYLMVFEQRIGAAVPYWNWYAEDASVDGAPGAGLPQAFKDMTYLHPVTGEVRPNPLRFAAAKGGVSKACAEGGPADECRWVHRDPVLYTEGDDHRAERTRKLGLTLLYQQQVQRALAFTDFSHPEGIGYPWANIPTFDPPPPDSEYVYRDYNFDGAYEQPHDNYHGWVGPDMADNSYTAFDPVFWSYHANIDRIFEIWLRRNYSSATFTANFPLHPFAGPRAEAFEFTDPRRFVYTTIGDIAKDCRGLGYDFAPPIGRDFGAGTQDGGGAASTSRAAPTVPTQECLVVFDGVRCTHDSYAVDVFLDQPRPEPADVQVGNPHYVGRLSRIGMGQEDDKGRCITHGVPRILDATAVATRLGISPGAAAPLTLLVSDPVSGALVPPSIYEILPGFNPRLLWATSGVAANSARRRTATAGPCCH